MAITILKSVGRHFQYFDYHHSGEEKHSDVIKNSENATLNTNSTGNVIYSRWRHILSSIKWRHIPSFW